MQNIFGKYDKQIKLLLAVLAGGLIIYAAYLFAKWLKGTTPPPGADDTVTVNQNNLTYQIGDYAIMADGLESAMQTSGTDEAAVLEIISQLQTADDLRQLIKTFGKRKNYTFGLPLYNENLIYWLNEELSGSDRDQVASVFASFNIPF